MSEKIILICDDDVQVIDFYKIVLESAGYKTVSCYSPEKMIDEARKLNPHAIILDIMFACGGEKIADGTDAARFLKSDEQLKHIPVLMISGIREITGTEEIFEPDDEWMPVEAFADKPVKPNILIEKIRQITGEVK